MTQYSSFHDLTIWKSGYQLLMQIYTLTEHFPQTEVYALTSQIQRSANSIIANIAESHGRYHKKDKIRVLYIARGELCETQSHIAVAYGRSYISKDMCSELQSKYTTLHKQLNSYISTLYH